MKQRIASLDENQHAVKAGHAIGDRTYKVHLDGYNLLPALSGKSDTWPRKEFFYWSDDGDLTALRYGRWKLVFMEQKARQFRVWMEPFVELRIPLIFDLRMDPFERASVDANSYYEWLERVGQFLAVPAQSVAGEMIESFREYPPRQKPSSFNLNDIMSGMSKLGEGK